MWWLKLCASLECINERVKSMYEYFGFKTYGIYQIGQNEVDANGEVNHEDKGFSIYFVIYYKGAIHEYWFNLFCQL